MLDAVIQLSVFSAKALILVLLILLLLVGIIAIISRGREKLRGQMVIKNLTEKYLEMKEALLNEILTKDEWKKFTKQKKADEKAKKKADNSLENKKVFVLSFDGDIKASGVAALREEVTAIINIANPLQDEVVVCLESGGGMVHAYGLAAAQLARIRELNIPLTVAVDKVAASGGYLMACVANKILAAPFAIIGSIGVIVQMPNFHRLLKQKNIDFEQLTAGDYKRTLTLFGENTEEGRQKLREEIEEIHHLFKNQIHHYRQSLDIEKIATGEHWMGTQALELNLVDEIKTSDDYLLALSKHATVYELSYQMKKSIGEKLAASVQLVKQSLLGV